MNAEIAKFRYLLLPRYASVASFLGVFITGVCLVIFTPKASESYVSVMGSVTFFLIQIISIVIGSWAATLEFASGTLQRTLTAESDRNRVLVAKLVVLLVAVLLVAAATAAVGGGLVDVATRYAGLGLDRSTLARSVFAALPIAVTSASVAFGLGLLTRSFGGGLSLTFIFIYVLDGVLTFIPHFSEVSYSRFTTSLYAQISGGPQADGPDILGVPASIGGTLVWMAILIIPGWVMFLRSDLK